MDVSKFPPLMRDLLPGDRLSPLGAGTPNESVRAKLEALSVESLFAPEKVRATEFAKCCMAGLWLYHDFLDPAHEVSQEIETTSGSYWHGIMHRREGDFSNANYWIRRVGAHPIFAPLREAAAVEAKQYMTDANATPWQKLFGGMAWDPFAFTDLCEAVTLGKAGGEMVCRRIAQQEWELLFTYCCRAALGLQ